MKNTFNGNSLAVSSRLDTAEEKISELESISIETIQNDGQRRKKNQKEGIKALVSCEKTPRNLTYV